MTSSTRLLLVAGGLVVAVVGFLLFRPDTLFTNVPVDQSLEEAFTTNSTTLATSAAAPTTTTSGTAASTSTATPSQSWWRRGHLRASITMPRDVNVYEQDGRFVLRFEDDTDIQNGPDLYVWVLPSELV